MITKLSLTNFKKHENLTINFGEGLVVLKGANEAGKSTCYHAIVYALFGARALPLSLAETVTYDKPEASLKVVLEFTYEGKNYKIQRSKSGATLSCGEVTANGQAEVTRFVESLLCINADIASKLMIASQKGLSGALEGNAAIPLIEKLANIDLIDGLITKVQEQLPCGNTRPFIATIEELEEVPVPKTDYKSIEPELKQAEDIIAAIKFNILNAKTNIQFLAIKEANETIANAAQQLINRANLNCELEAVEKELAKPYVKYTGDIESLRVKLAEQLNFKEREEAYKKFLDQPTTPDLYTQTNALRLHISTLKEAIKVTEARINDLRVELVKVQTTRIDDESCSLCGKLLQDVPEVVTKNLELSARFLELSTEKTERELTLKYTRENLATLNNYQKVNEEVEKLYAAISKYVTVEYTVPIQLRWVGDIPLQADLTDYASEIKKAEAEKVLAIQAQANWDNLKARKEIILYNLSCLNVCYLTEEAQEIIDTHAKLTTELEVYINKLHHAEMIAQQVKHKLETAKSEYRHEEEAYLQAREGIAKARGNLLLYEKHNSLIKKLREARPLVAARLWSIVLATVSTYFSQIRGFRSVVTRETDSFLVNGKPVGGVSGSTFDSLGLAMRMALSKTFLPVVDFILLDEPASGMDDERETAMLGLLSVASYRQILLVTHSCLADSFAGSVVQL